MSFQLIGGASGNKSVLNYGADSSGVASANTAFSAMLASEGYIYVPQGTFLLEDFELNSALMQGIGTIKRKSGATYAVIMKGSDPRINGITFDTDQSAVNGESEIKLDDGCQRPVIENCKFNGTLYACVSADANGSDDTSLTYTAPVDGFVFRNNIIRGAYSRHLYLHSVEDIKIIDNDFAESTRDSIRLRQATKKCIISGNTFKDIGAENPSIVERPQNWLSNTSYTLGTLVSVNPTGIYECTVANSTIGANPSTTGAGEWDLVTSDYFETKDVLDAFWSGEELIITNNIVDTTASFGFDIKGTTPTGEYSTSKVIVSNNIVKNCFGVALNLSSADLLSDNSFAYSGTVIIDGNYFTGNNRERFDISQSPIMVRQGVRNVTISNNIIEGNYARGLTVANLSDDAEICKNIQLINNKILSNGIPGHPSNIGVNCSPVDGLQIIGNTIRNNDPIQEYKVSVSGTASTVAEDTYSRNFVTGQSWVGGEAGYNTSWVAGGVKITGTGGGMDGFDLRTGNFAHTPVYGVQYDNLLTIRVYVESYTGDCELYAGLAGPYATYKTPAQITAAVGSYLTFTASAGSTAPDFPGVYLVNGTSAEIVISKFEIDYFYAAASETLTIPTRGDLATISVTVNNGDTPYDIVQSIYNRITGNDSLVSYDTVTSYYYGNAEIEETPTATITSSSGQLTWTADALGVAGNGLTVTITPSGGGNLYPQAGDFSLTGNDLTITCRTSTKPFHLLSGFTSNAPAPVKALFNVALTQGIPSDAASQVAVSSETVTLTGGVDPDAVYFDARVSEALTPGTINGSGYTVTVERQNRYSNSVQNLAMSIKDTETVGSTTFVMPTMSAIIKDNHCESDAVSGERYNILYNNAEPPALFAYVSSDNTDNVATMSTMARTNFANGANASDSTHINTQAYITVQDITIKARQFGISGNDLAFEIEQQVGNSQPTRVTIAPTIFGGKEIILKLPTDSGGSPQALTVEAAELALKAALGQGIAVWENNYIGAGYIPQKDIPTINYENTGNKDTDGTLAANSSTKYPSQSAVKTYVDTSISTNLASFEGRSLDPSVGIDIVDNWISGTAVGNLGWTLFTNSGAIGANLTLGSDANMGLCYLRTSTSSSAAPTVSLGSGASIILGSKNFAISYLMKIPTLSSGSEEFIVRIGMFGHTTGTISGNGVWFEYDRATSVNWRICSCAGGVTSYTTTSTAVSAGTWNKFTMSYTGSGADMDFLIDGVSIGTITSGLPSGTSQGTGPAFQIVKTVGTTERTMVVDWFRFTLTY